MNREPSQPPALAAWLLRHVCARENREELIGDLLERFAERPSRGWFWSQVLTAILVGAARSVQAHWPQVCFAIAGTALDYLSWPGRSQHLAQLWWWGSLGLPWPLSAAFEVSFYPAVGVLMVQPLLATLLFLNRTFSWFSLIRTYLMSFALGSALNLASIVGAFKWFRGPEPLFWPLLNFFTFLVAAWIGCRLPPGARVYGVRIRFEKRTR
jgi:hypothetical protein